MKPASPNNKLLSTQKIQKKENFCRFANECWLEIFMFCPLPALVRLSLVRRRFWALLEPLIFAGRRSHIVYYVNIAPPPFDVVAAQENDSGVSTTTTTVRMRSAIGVSGANLSPVLSSSAAIDCDKRRRGIRSTDRESLVGRRVDWPQVPAPLSLIAGFHHITMFAHRTRPQPFLTSELLAFFEACAEVFMQRVHHATLYIASASLLASLLAWNAEDSVARLLHVLAGAPLFGISLEWCSSNPPTTIEECGDEAIVCLLRNDNRIVMERCTDLTIWLCSCCSFVAKTSDASADVAAASADGGKTTTFRRQQQLVATLVCWLRHEKKVTTERQRAVRQQTRKLVALSTPSTLYGFMPDQVVDRWLEIRIIDHESPSQRFHHHHHYPTTAAFGQEHDDVDDHDQTDVAATAAEFAAHRWRCFCCALVDALVAASRVNDDPHKKKHLHQRPLNDKDEHDSFASSSSSVLSSPSFGIEIITPTNFLLPRSPTSTSPTYISSADSNDEFGEQKQQQPLFDALTSRLNPSETRQKLCDYRWQDSRESEHLARWLFVQHPNAAAEVCAAAQLARSADAAMPFDEAAADEDEIKRPASAILLLSCD